MTGKRGEGDIISPVTAKILSVNDVLTKNPGKLYNDPMEEGWIAEILLENLSEIGNNNFRMRILLLQ